MGDIDSNSILTPYAKPNQCCRMNETELSLQENSQMMVDDVEDEDEIDNFQRRHVVKRKKAAKKMRPTKPVQIKIVFTATRSQVACELQDVKMDHSLPSFFEETNTWDEFDDEEFDTQFDDSLSFFQETHEDQDPAYIAYTHKLEEEERQKQLTALDVHDQKTRSEIEAIISDLCKEKQAATDRSLEKYKQRAAEDEKLKTERYKELYRQKTSSNMRKINEGIEILQQRHQKELETAMGHHRQHVRNRRLNEQMAAGEWHATSQSITNKHKMQLAGFRDKGNELKKQTESDYQREQEKIHKQHMLRLQEVDSSRQKLQSRLYQQIQQLRQRYLKRHLQKLMKEKEVLLSKGPSLINLANHGNTRIENVDSTESDTLPGSQRPPILQRDATKSTLEERAELNPSSPIRSAEKWVDESPHPVAGAATRHKHRKGVMNQTTRQLSIEIHNEGLWLSTCPVEPDNNTSADKSNESARSAVTVDYEFLPWCVKAHRILEAIVAGELPHGIFERILEQHPNADELMALQAGQVRCTVSDLRTSEETASSHRVVALAEYEESQLKELEQTVADTQKLFTETETMLARAIQEEKEKTTIALNASEKEKQALRTQDEFKQKFKSFLGPGKRIVVLHVAIAFREQVILTLYGTIFVDGKPNPDAKASDRQELSQALQRYNNDLDTASNAMKVAKIGLTEAKAKIQKLQAFVKATQRNVNAAVSEFKKKHALMSNAVAVKGEKNSKQADGSDTADRAFFRVKSVIGALRKTADRRRDQADQKKSTSFSSAWVQSFPGLPSSLKKSLWHKMHRRKQPVILRPSPESFVVELRASIAAIVAAKFTGRLSAEKMEIVEAEQLKAEQLLLITMHPLVDDAVTAIPPTRSSDTWAEPGWHLNLSTENLDEERRKMILPCANPYPVLATNLSEIASAPGRQAASLLRSSHFGCLASPLSTFAVASSPAETNTSLTNTREYEDHFRHVVLIIVFSRSDSFYFYTGTYSISDPLYVNEDDMALGYAFTLKQQASRPSVSRRKSASSKSTSDLDAMAETTLNSIEAFDGNSKNAGQGTSKSESRKIEYKRRRSSTKKTSDVPVPSSSRSKKPKHDNVAPVPTNPSGTAHFNPIMQQQQHQPPPLLPQQPPPQQRLSQLLHHQQQRQHMPPIQQQQAIQQQRQPQHHAGQRHQVQHAPQHPTQHSTQIPHQPQHPQQQYSPQMAHLHMMQQQQQAMSPRHQQAPANYPPQAMQQMQQFYAPLTHPPPMHIQGRPGPPHPPPHPPPIQPGQPKNQPGQNDANDPLFMLQ